MFYLSSNKFRITRIKPQPKKRYSSRLYSVLLLVLVFLAEQCGMMTVSINSIQADALGTKEYIYVRHSATIDDSWIGTPVAPVKKVAIKKVTTKKTTVAKKKTTYTPTPA